METKELIHLRLLGDPDNIPKDEGDGRQFWDMIKSSAFKDSVLVLLLSSIPRKEVASMDAKECRTHLANIQSLHRLLDVPRLFSDHIKPKDDLKNNPGSDLDGYQDTQRETLTQD